MSTYIDPHIHMISRVTDDYQRLAQCGCVALSEPAFWAGFDRGSAEGFRDYFRHLAEVEPRRAEQFGIRHYCWLCINAKEAENVRLSREVIALIPHYLKHPNVLGIGEIGLNKNTANEAIVFQEHVDMAVRTDELILIHTPHLEDKYKGTRMILDMLKGDRRVHPQRVCIDHVEEHTIRPALENGYWCGMTLYPVTKCTPERAVDMIEMYGTDRIMVNSAGDWGKSNPLAVPEFIQEMKRRGHSQAAIRKVVYNNPLTFFRQCARWVDFPSWDEDTNHGQSGREVPAGEIRGRGNKKSRMVRR
jgi:predicted metal-dependent TIM-barrel fold hydrolase